MFKCRRGFWDYNKVTCQFGAILGHCNGVDIKAN